MTFPGNSSFIFNAFVEEEGNTGIVTVQNQQASVNLRSSSGIVKEQGTLTQVRMHDGPSSSFHLGSIGGRRECVV